MNDYLTYPEMTLNSAASQETVASVYHIQPAFEVGYAEKITWPRFSTLEHRMNEIDATAYDSGTDLANAVAAVMLEEFPQAVAVKMEMRTEASHAPHITIFRRRAERVTVALGSNNGDAANNVLKAMGRIGLSEKVSRFLSSSLYTSKVFEDEEDDYINVVCQFDYEGTPLELLEKLKAIEDDMDREAGNQSDNRIINIGLIYFGEREIHRPELIVPHPFGMLQDFVKIPYKELTEQIVVRTDETHIYRED